MRVWITIITLLWYCSFCAVRAGDFDELNAILKDAVIYIGDTSVAEGLILNLSIKNLRCTNFAIGDMSIVSTQRDTRNVQLEINVVDLNMDCLFDYNYQTLIFFGSGRAALQSYGNDASTMIVLGSTDFDQFPPTSVTLESCSASINLSSLQFLDGGIFSLAPVESLLARVVERQAEKLICNQLQDLSLQQVAQILGSARNALSKYPSDLQINHLSAEQAFQVLPEGPKLMNFKRPETEVGQLFQFGLEEAVAFLSKPVLTNDGSTELNANVLLRKFLLEDRALVLNITDFDFMSDGILWDKEDKLTNTKVQLNSVKLLGLDTFIRFQLLEIIGNYTVQNQLTWEYMAFELDATITIKPSRAEDSVLVNPGNTSVVERVTIKFGVENLNAVASFMLAIDQVMLESIELGSLMQSKDLVSCILSTFVNVDISGLSVSVTNVLEPTLHGFVSPGLDRVASQAAMAAFNTYEASLLKAAPAFFQIAIREALVSKIREEIENQVSKGGCPVVDLQSGPNDFVDFRDLLLEPGAAQEVGGTGSQPYGDVASVFATQMNDRFISSDASGLPKLNTAIRPLTQAQSGVAGEFRISDPYSLFSYTATNASMLESVIRHVEIESSSIAASQLDTIVRPLNLLTAVGAHNLTNSINMGPVPNRSLTLSTELLFRIDGASSLAVSNLFILSASFQNSITFDILSTVMDRNVFQFPLRDLLNINCWLAALPPPEVDVAGNVMERTMSNDALELSRFHLDIKDLDFDIRCVSCTSAGGEALPEILKAMRGSGATEVIQDRFQDFLNEIAVNYWESLELHLQILEARKLCPHSPYYLPTMKSSFVWPGLPFLSREATESMAVFAMLAANFGMVLTAKSHLLSPIEPTDPLSGQLAMTPPNEGKLIDWTNVGDSLGDWAVSALGQVQSYVADPTEDEITGEIDIGANILIRNLLDDSGAFELDVEEFSVFSGGRIEASVRSIRIFGLDSMIEANIFDVVGTQTLTNRLRFETVRLEFDILFSEEETAYVETATVSFALNNVDVNLSLLLAIEWQRLGEMKVGSVLHLMKIIPCMVSKFHAISITQLLVNAESVDEPQIDGFLSQEAASTLSETSRRFLSNFTDDVLDALPKICDVSVRKLLNEILVDFLTREEVYCSYQSEVSSGGIIDFRDLFLSEELSRSFGGSGLSQYGDTFRILYKTLQEQLSAVNELNQPMLNENFIRPLTYELSNVNGSLIFPGEALNMSGTARFNNWVVSMEGRVTNARIENLDSVGNSLKLLMPVAGQASVLNNSLSIGVGPQPLRFSARMYLSLSDAYELDLQNEVDVILKIDTLNLIISVFLAMSESSFFSLPLNLLQDPNCWLSTISPESFNVDDSVSSWFKYGLSAERTSLNISCVRCGSPRFGDLIEQLYSPGETQEDADQFVQEAKEFIDQLLGSDFLQSVASAIVSDASKSCPVGEAYDAGANIGEFSFAPFFIESLKRDSIIVIFNIANSIVAAVLIVIALVARCLIRRNNKKWLESLPEDQVDLVHRQDESELRKDEFLNMNTDSMFRSEQIPVKIRYAVPFVLLLNICLYLSAHIAVLSYINLEANIAGESFTVERFIEFSFFESAIGTFQNGGKEMSIFLIICSGIWPYAKLLGALVLWFVPPHRLSVAHRGKIFLWMDVLTKLSIIDVVTMLLGIAALLVYIGGPGQELYNSDELYAMTLVVVPQPGFYCIIIAQRLNRVSSRFFLDYHSKIVSSASEEYKNRHERDISKSGTIFVSRMTLDTVLSSKGCSVSRKSSNTSTDAARTIVQARRNQTRVQEICNDESSYSSEERPPEMLVRCETSSENSDECANNRYLLGNQAESSSHAGDSSVEGSTQTGWDPSLMYGHPVISFSERTTINAEKEHSNALSVAEKCISDSTKIAWDPSRMYANPASSFEGSTYIGKRPEGSSRDVESCSSFEEGSYRSGFSPLIDANQRDQMLSFEDSTIEDLESPSRIKNDRQENSDFLFYDQTDSFTKTNSPRKEAVFSQKHASSWPMDAFSSGLRSNHCEEWCTCFQRRHMLGGSLAVAFAAVFTAILFIIGCTLAPSLSMDAKEVLSIMLESGRTYKEAVTDFNVFRVVSLVLLQTRFALSSVADYVGLGILLSLAGLSVVLFPAMQGWKLLREWYRNWKQFSQTPLGMSTKGKGKPKSIIPGFTNRLKVWNHMEVFIISFCIANWQLGSVVSYFLHNYCDLLNRFYEALAYVGIVEKTKANCFRAQAADPLTLLIMITSFFILLISFMLQMRDQFKKNKAHIEELLGDDEVVPEEDALDKTTVNDK